MGNMNGANNPPAMNRPPSAQEVLLSLYQQESFLRKKLAELSARLNIIEAEKADVYASLEQPQEGAKTDNDMRSDLKASLESIAELAGITGE